MPVGSGCREKTWQELDTDGKIERLRQVLRDSEEGDKRLVDFLNAVAVHEHGTDGKMVSAVCGPPVTVFRCKKRPEGFLG